MLLIGIRKKVLKEVFYIYYLVCFKKIVIILRRYLTLIVKSILLLLFILWNLTSKSEKVILKLKKLINRGR